MAVGSRLTLMCLVFALVGVTPVAAAPPGLSMKVLKVTQKCHREDLPSIDACSWLCLELELAVTQTLGSDTSVSIAAPSRRHRPGGARLIFADGESANVGLIQVLAGSNVTLIDRAETVPSGTKADLKCSGVTFGYWIPTDVGDSYVDLSSGQNLSFLTVGRPNTFGGAPMATGVKVNFIHNRPESTRLLLIFPVPAGKAPKSLHLEPFPDPASLTP